MLKNTFFRLSLFVFLLLGCSQKPSSADPATLELVKASGDSASTVLILHPAQFPKVQKRLKEFVAKLGLAEQAIGVLDAPDLEKALSALARKLDFDFPEKLAGWDQSRPMVAALSEPVFNDTIRLAQDGIPLRTDAELTGQRHRLIIPATDTHALQVTIGKVLTGMKAKKQPMGGEVAGLKGGDLYSLDALALAVAVIPEKDYVRVELAQNESLKQNLEFMQECLKSDPKAASLLMTPALQYAASKPDFWIYYIRSWKLRDLALEFNVNRLLNAASFASPGEKNRLLALGLSEIGQGYLLMSPLGAEFEDATVVFEFDKGVGLSVVASLTEQGQRVFQSGAWNQIKPVEPKGKNFLASAWMRMNLAKMFKVAQPPEAISEAKDLTSMVEVLREGGWFCFLDLLLRRPMGYASKAWQLFAVQEKLKVSLPQSLSLVLLKMNLDKEGLPTAIEAALAMTFEAGTDVSWVQGLKALVQGPAVERFKLEVVQETSGGQEVVLVGLNTDPKKAFTGPELKPKQVLAQVEANLAALTQSLGTGSPGSSLSFDQTRFQVSVSRRALVLRTSMGSADDLRDAGELAAFSDQSWESPGLAEASSKGNRCLAEVNKIMFKGLRALSFAHPIDYSKLYVQVLDEAKDPLACALAEKDTQERARQLQLKTMLYAAQELGDSWNIEEQLGVLSKACQQGLAPACEQEKQVRQKPVVNLAKVSLAWGQAVDPMQPVWIIPSQGQPVVPALDSPPDPAYMIVPLLAIDAQVKYAKVAEAISQIGQKGIDHYEVLVQDPKRSARTMRLDFYHPLIREPKTPQKNTKKAAGEPKGILGLLQNQSEDTADVFERVPFVVKVDQGNLEAVGDGKATVLNKRKDCPKGETCIDQGALWEIIERLDGERAIFVDASPNTPWSQVALVLASRPSKSTAILGPIPEHILKTAKTLKKHPDLMDKYPQGLEQPIISGPIDKDGIRKVIFKHQKEIKACYEKELARNPSLQGKVTITFTISEVGIVAKASMKSTTVNNPTLESCILQTVKRMQFSKPLGGGIVIVEYPFIFKTP